MVQGNFVDGGYFIDSPGITQYALRAIVWSLNDSGMGRPDYIWSIKHTNKANMGIHKSVGLSFCRKEFAKFRFIIESWLQNVVK